VPLRDGAFTDQSLRDAKIRERFGVTVVAVSQPDGVVFNPAPETILRPGDVLRVFGLGAQITAFAESTRDKRRRGGLDGDWMHS
jgi:K+/H+ antiporter YhaU regulatory subunit KhtT